MLKNVQAGQLSTFQDQVWEYYHAHGRHDLPWRLPNAAGGFDPYHIIVSEIMLQQTQVPRVLPKFLAFVEQFPTMDVLAAAPLAAVLQAWSGLGYNRRAKFLWQAAQAITERGTVPQTAEELIQLPGIGKNTAGAILAYAFNKPVIFIETNIRTAYIHHFFADQAVVYDRDIADLVAATLPDMVREWYWALMDYGAFLKQAVGNASRTSAHYTRQSTFSGSRRQLRGQIVKLLSERAYDLAELQACITDERLPSVLEDLTSEALIDRNDTRYSLSGA